MTEPRPDAREVTLRLAALKALLDKVKDAYGTARNEALVALDPGDRKSAVTDSGRDIGTVSYVKGRTTLNVSDTAALTAWVQENAPTEVESTVRVRPAYLAALIKRCRVAGRDVFDVTGELVPGLRPTIGEPYVSAKQSDDQYEAFTAAYMEGELLLPLGSALRGVWPELERNPQTKEN